MREDDPLITIGEPGSAHDIGVYGAPRPAVPERVPLAPRTKGCASGAGSLGTVAPGEFRRLPPWLKVQLPGVGEYAGTKALLREKKLVTVCEEARCPNLGHCWARGTAASAPWRRGGRTGSWTGTSRAAWARPSRR